MFISRKQSSEAFLVTKIEKNKDTGFRTKMEKKMEMFSSRNGASERSFHDENMENKMDTFSSRNWSNAKSPHNEKLEKKMDIGKSAKLVKKMDTKSFLLDG